jgi:uncharacterized protein YlxW (UPF0749 family)
VGLGTSASVVNALRHTYARVWETPVTEPHDQPSDQPSDQASGQPSARPQQRPRQPPQDEATPGRGRGAVELLRRLFRLGTTGQSGIGWRLVVPVVFAAAGFMFVTSAEASNGIDLRPQRAASLAELVQSESDRVDRLQQRAGELEDDISALTSRAGSDVSGRLQTRSAQLRAAAGMQPVTGQALRVTLDDAPSDQPVPEGLDANAMVVHQQDLQAVVNALWAGGAKAITLQDQRLISTTGIKCVGNTVVLHGVPYSPPYEIVAVGDPVQLQSALDASAYVQTYLQYTQEPVNIGWDVDLLTHTTVPGYEGSLNLRYAEAATRPPSSAAGG